MLFDMGWHNCAKGYKGKVIKTYRPIFGWVVFCDMCGYIYSVTKSSGTVATQILNAKANVAEFRHHEKYNRRV